jgi:hypothetical protein
MFHSDEDELISIGAVTVADGTNRHDTTSDHSDWVRQYADWTEGETQSSVNLLRERSTAIKFPTLSAVEGASERIDDYCLVL